MIYYYYAYYSGILNIIMQLSHQSSEILKLDIQNVNECLYHFLLSTNVQTKIKKFIQLIMIYVIIKTQWEKPNPCENSFIIFGILGLNSLLTIHFRQM